MRTFILASGIGMLTVVAYSQQPTASCPPNPTSSCATHRASGRSTTDRRRDSQGDRREADELLDGQKARFFEVDSRIADQRRL